MLQGMKKGGLDKATAQRILKVWEETGAASPEGLRKMLLGRSLRTVGVVSLQLLLDAGAFVFPNLLVGSSSQICWWERPKNKVTQFLVARSCV